MAPPMTPLALTPVITPVTGAIGAVVEGVDLTAPLDAATVELVRAALHEHSVIFFHDQDLDEEQQIAFASHFGTVAPYALTKMLGETRLTSIIEDTADSPPDADGWHTDVSWVAEPPAYAVLNAKVIPERGGDTMWSSLFAAYDALSPVMRVCATSSPSVITRGRTSATASPAPSARTPPTAWRVSSRRSSTRSCARTRSPVGARCGSRAGSWTRSSACTAARATRCSAT